MALARPSLPQGVRVTGPPRRSSPVAPLLQRWSPGHAHIGRFWGRSLWQMCRGNGWMDGPHGWCHKRPRQRQSTRVGPMGILSEIFSWWGGNTWSNRLYTAVRGRFVGSDEAGNRYYVQRRGVGPLGGP